MNQIAGRIHWMLSHPASKGRTLKVLSGWAYWQLRQRFTSKPKLMQHLADTRLMVYPHEGLTGYWYLGRPDYDELMFLERYLRPNDVFYDVGANAGAFAMLAGGVGCQVVAFEPVPLTFDRLCENAKLNEHIKLSLRNCAVGSSLGILKITTGYGTGNHILSDGEMTDFVEVNVVTLNSVILDTPCPTFIKADVEGFELEMLRGATEVLQSQKLQGLLLETFRPHNWNQPKLQAIEALLSENGFLPFRYDVKSNTISQLMQPHDGNSNTFYFRSPEEVVGRLQF